ncbi:Domain of unknown function DUF1840 [Leptothrix cholodnii SP-6]|uniref:DUF1840 domain-containing protein n=1 Tax=Leptothrix cholodnii (strain ATCC 51168 / LMG 8142 / SP-6) TaxID=395495 RepID=B1Y8E4_LEPCP|nr:DUF1840 domain-containing protein [Leptothrix cholodnii]ACB36210.1 Domain of unknown function DUF1840 [Leptothrix cholodnii SP-6]
MLYKFKSKAAGDVIMTAPIGDRILRLLDREPAAQGIFEVEAMPGAIAALEAAIVADEALRRAAEAEAAADPEPRSPPPPGRDNVSLRQRAWPLIEMMKRCHAEDAPIVWGV